MKTVFCFLLIVCAFLSACSKKEVMKPSEGLEVKIVVASGWCGYVKTIVLNKNQTSKDLRGNTCQRSSVNTVAATDEKAFQKLNTYLLKLNLFDRKIQECSRCSDGVDYMLTINDGTQVIEHSIGFENKETGMAEFIAFMEAL